MPEYLQNGPVRLRPCRPLFTVIFLHAPRFLPDPETTHRGPGAEQVTQAICMILPK